MNRKAKRPAIQFTLVAGNGKIVKHCRNIPQRRNNSDHPKAENDHDYGVGLWASSLPEKVIEDQQQHLDDNNDDPEQLTGDEWPYNNNNNTNNNIEPSSAEDISLMEKYAYTHDLLTSYARFQIYDNSTPKEEPLYMTEGEFLEYEENKQQADRLVEEVKERDSKHLDLLEMNEDLYANDLRNFEHQQQQQHDNVRIEESPSSTSIDLNWGLRYQHHYSVPQTIIVPLQHILLSIEKQTNLLFAQQQGKEIDIHIVAPHRQTNDPNVIVLEYFEQPLHYRLQNGMASQIQKFTNNDKEKEGGGLYVGEVPNDENDHQVLYTSLFRAPIAKHTRLGFTLPQRQITSTNNLFLLKKDSHRGSWSIIQELSSTILVGQLQPSPPLTLDSIICKPHSIEAQVSLLVQVLHFLQTFKPTNIYVEELIRWFCPIEEQEGCHTIIQYFQSKTPSLLSSFTCHMTTNKKVAAQSTSKKKNTPSFKPKFPTNYQYVWNASTGAYSYNNNNNNNNQKQQHQQHQSFISQWTPELVCSYQSMLREQIRLHTLGIHNHFVKDRYLFDFLTKREKEFTELQEKKLEAEKYQNEHQAPAANNKVSKAYRMLELATKKVHPIIIGKLRFALFFIYQQWTSSAWNLSNKILEVYNAKKLSEIELEDWPNVFGRKCGMSYAAGFLATQIWVDKFNPCHVNKIIESSWKPKNKEGDLRRLKKADYQAKFDKLGVPIEAIENLNRWEKATRLGECAEKEVNRANKYGSEYDPSIVIYHRRRQWSIGKKRPPIWDRIDPLIENLWKFIELTNSNHTLIATPLLYPVFSGKPYNQWKQDEEDQNYESKMIQTIYKSQNENKDDIVVLPRWGQKMKKQKAIKMTRSKFEKDGKMTHHIEYIRNPMMIESLALDQKFKHQSGFRFISHEWNHLESTGLQMS